MLHAGTLHAGLRSARSARWIALLAVLLGCGGASVPSDLAFCQRSNWYRVGERDGKSGERPDRVRLYQNRCEDEGVSVDAGLYRAGYEAGQSAYCQPQRGYDLGREGAQVRDVCPDSVGPVFFANYEKGLEAYCTRSNLFKVGREGRAYRGVCSRGAERGLESSFESGKRVHDLESRLGEMTAEIQDTERSLTFFKDRDKRDGLDQKLRRLRRERIELERVVNAALVSNGLKDNPDQQ